MTIMAIGWLALALHVAPRRPRWSPAQLLDAADMTVGPFAGKSKTHP